jgi:hypothetical protein
MTKKDIWKPRPKQKKLLEAAQVPELNRTVTAICDEAGIKRNTFYTWIKKDEDFRNAWNEVWEWAIDRHMPSVVAAQLKKAQGGDTYAARYLSDLSGRMIRNIDVKSGGEVLKAYVGISPEDWDE